MTLLLREVGRFLLEAGAWICAVGSLAAIVALPIGFVNGRRMRWRVAGFAAVGGAVLAAAAHRIGIGLWSPHVTGRPLPILWVLVGSAGVASATLWREQRATR